MKGERLEVKGMPCKGLKNSAQGNALGGKENEYERLKAAEQRLIATASQVNVAEQRLNAAEQRVNCDDSQVNAPCAVNVAEQRLKDSQS